MKKVAVACPHCGHLTHVDLPTQEIGQVCGVCGVGYIYPWEREVEVNEKEADSP